MSSAAKRTRVEHIQTGAPEVRKAREPGARLTSQQLLLDIAKHPMFIRNVRVPEFVEAFPYNPELRTVSRYFPVAAGGPLFVDEYEKSTPEQVRKHLEQKREVMKKSGKRYLIVGPTTDMIDAMEQLER